METAGLLGARDPRPRPRASQKNTTSLLLSCPMRRVRNQSVCSPLRMAAAVYCFRHTTTRAGSPGRARRIRASGVCGMWGVESVAFRARATRREPTRARPSGKRTASPASGHACARRRRVRTNAAVLTSPGPGGWLIARHLLRSACTCERGGGVVVHCCSICAQVQREPERGEERPGSG